MLIVGEKINTSRGAIAPAVEKRDAGFIREIARKQVANGAAMIDVNAGTLLDGEPDALAWLVQTVQAELDVPCCIDSPNPVAIQAALEVHRGKALINSISAETERFSKIAPLAGRYGCSVVGLCMDDGGIPETAAGRAEVAGKLVARLNDLGVKNEDIYLDPLVQPISVNFQAAAVTLDTIGAITAEFPGVHRICGLSNVSFGLPVRKLINQSFMVMAMDRGLDAAIVDPLDGGLMALTLAANALAGRDEYCTAYLAAYRRGKLEV